MLGAGGIDELEVRGDVADRHKLLYDSMHQKETRYESTSYCPQAGLSARYHFATTKRTHRLLRLAHVAFGRFLHPHDRTICKVLQCCAAVVVEAAKDERRTGYLSLLISMVGVGSLVHARAKQEKQ